MQEEDPVTRLPFALAILWTSVYAGSVYAQTPARVEFDRDILPILRQNCIACHGSSQQSNGLRLDRRSSVFTAGVRRVVPGSSDNSFLYHRLIGSQFGMQMPPSGPLRPEAIDLIRRWIEEGAEWPDALANEADVPPPSARAVALVEALRSGDRQSFLKSVEQDPGLLNARGPNGSTPFMYAVLYADAATVKQLLQKGANPNARNDVNATALMRAATDLEKTRVLLAHGADVNVRSDDLRTPLMIAAGRTGGAPIVKVLLDHGANPNPTTNPGSESSPLVQAAIAGDADSMQLLIKAGADIAHVGASALALSVMTKCQKCVDLLTAQGLDRSAYTVALLQNVTSGDVRAIRTMLDKGADVNAVDPMGRTALMYAAVSDLVPADAIKMLIERGADVNALSRHAQSGDSGQSVLSLAKLHGDTPLVTLLVKAGATEAGRPAPALRTIRGNTIPNAIQRSLPLLQRADAGFTKKSGCVSCHNNSLPAMTVGLARANGFSVNEQIAAEQVRANVSFLEQRREGLHQGFLFPLGDFFSPGILSYILIGLHAENYKADLNTDAVAMFLRSRQMSDGQWAYSVGDTRPPLGSWYIGQTALSMRALQLYAPKADKPGYDESVSRATAWLAKAEARTTEDRMWRLLGLAWSGSHKDAIRTATRELLSFQRADGGWSDLPSMSSNVYATGRALCALHTAGIPVSDPAYRRAVQFLLNAQTEDGSWYVQTRAAGFQPYFDAGFPYGVDQWMSAAGSSWATMALILASGVPAGSAPIARTP
jgi:ankyrin repeat protein